MEDHSVIDREEKGEEEVAKLNGKEPLSYEEPHQTFQHPETEGTAKGPPSQEAGILEPVLQEGTRFDQQESPSNKNDMESKLNGLESLESLESSGDDFFNELQQPIEGENGLEENDLMEPADEVARKDIDEHQADPIDEGEAVNNDFFNELNNPTETEYEQNHLSEGTGPGETIAQEGESDDFFRQLAEESHNELVSEYRQPFYNEEVAEVQDQDVQDRFLNEIEQPVNQAESFADERQSVINPLAEGFAHDETAFMKGIGAHDETDFMKELAVEQTAETLNHQDCLKQSYPTENISKEDSPATHHDVDHLSKTLSSHDESKQTEQTDDFLKNLIQPSQTPADDTDDPFLRELSQPKEESADKLAFLAMDDELLDEDLLEEILDDDLLEDDLEETSVQQTQKPAYTPSQSSAGNPYAALTPSTISTPNINEQKKKTDAYDFPTEFLRTKSANPPKAANKYTNVFKQVETPAKPLTMTPPKKEAFFEELPVQPVIQKRKRAGSRAVDPYAAIESPNSAPVSAVPPVASRRSSPREVKNPYAPVKAPASEGVPPHSISSQAVPVRSASSQYVPSAQSVPPSQIPSNSVPSVPSVPPAIANPTLKKKPSTISGRYRPSVSVQPDAEGARQAAQVSQAPHAFPNPPQVPQQGRPYTVQVPPKKAPQVQAPPVLQVQMPQVQIPQAQLPPHVPIPLPQNSLPHTSAVPLKNPNALLHRQFPIWTWSQGPKVVKLIPKTDGYQVENSIEVLSVTDAGLVNPLTAFPGPLSAKSKRKDLEKWVEQLLESSQASDPLSLLWSVMLELLRHNGPLSDFALSKSVALLMNPNASIVSDKPALDLSAFTGIKTKNPNAHQMDKLALGSLLSILLSGDKNSALTSAISEQDWALALLLGQLAGPQEFKTTFDFFLQARFQLDPSLKILGFLLECIAGSVDAKNVDHVWLSANFGPVVSIMLLNLDNPSPLFYQMGNAFTQGGEYSKICFILAQCATLTPPEKPVRYDVDSVLLDEVYGYLKEQQPSPQTVVRYAAHAGLLADYGKFSEARRYCDAVAPLIKPFSKTLHPSLILQLQNLSARVSHLDTSESGWFGMSKPNMDKVWGQLDKSFSKFVSGEDTLPPVKVDENSVFSKYSPSISRTQSVADLKSFPFPQRMSSHGSASMENLALSNAHRSATTPRLNTVAYVSPKKPRQPRGRYAPEPKVVPDTRLEFTPQPSNDFPESLPLSEPDLLKPNIFEPELSGSEVSETREDYNPFANQTESPDHNLPAEHPQLENPYFPKMDRSVETSVYSNDGARNSYFPTEDFKTLSDSPVPRVSVPQERAPSANRYAPPPQRASPPSAPSLSMNVDSADEDEGPYEDFVEDEDEPSEKEEKVEEKPPSKSETPATHNEAGKKGWFGWLKKEKDENQPIKAKLGEQNQFFYDEKLKRWINKNAPPEENAVSTPPPPPVKIKKPVLSAPPPGVGPPTTSPIPSKPANGPPPKIAVPPSHSVSPPIKPPASTDLDDIMAMAAAGGNARRGKRGPRRGYVDVMNQK